MRMWMSPPPPSPANKRGCQRCEPNLHANVRGHRRAWGACQCTDNDDEGGTWERATPLTAHTHNGTAPPPHTHTDDTDDTASSTGWLPTVACRGTEQASGLDVAAARHTAPPKTVSSSAGARGSGATLSKSKALLKPPTSFELHWLTGCRAHGRDPQLGNEDLHSTSQLPPEDPKPFLTRCPLLDTVADGTSIAV